MNEYRICPDCDGEGYRTISEEEAMHVFGMSFCDRMARARFPCSRCMATGDIRVEEETDE